MISRRAVLTAAAAPWLGARAEAFPQRPVSLWVPWAAGGATDQTLRLLAELAGRLLGQKVLVENRGGAGGTLVMPVLQQAAPDGHTIAQMPQPVFRAPHLHKLSWDPIRDTTPILQLSGVSFGVLVPASAPWRCIDDLLAFAAAHPGALSIATNGVGTTPHLVLDELFTRHHLSTIHVPYKGTAEQMLAVASGQVMVGVGATGFAPFVDSGRLRLLAMTGAARARRWPGVPTLAELGHGIVAMSPYGLAGPRGLAPAVVQALHDAFKTALFDPPHVAELAKFDQEPAYLGSADYGRSMREAFAAERRVVERLGLRPAAD
ncbi:tripartite tricarboxylate transporter substrate binding protein [Aquincola sp. S2]|uniref:Tripartite tricarboxylate transporter substrate binding protein n=1 Tax=Pseudaquabacterium terrae TaxID=2732868 RepID=A0ABX2ER18_9BURK|nr:tripartite tricarboxylate transporter substrate binding protein [Aquabacterium terrae]NRF70987.1 tripartite tricarboxylate transporter substrate binding protein [Aquabacterium terrae]